MTLSACTTVQFDGTEDRLQVYPTDVGKNGVPTQGVVVWGGQVMALTNSEEGTILQILAVPIDSGNVPQPDSRSVGRFIAFYPGFLEPRDYGEGRWVTLAGDLDGLADAQVGEYVMSVPYVKVRQIHLWPPNPYNWSPNWNVGVGVGVTL
ncbi:Slp family lipoprotein [Marinihelvus fidelis]|uniref:Slp family lipoprotein n=1 Tax=Marinihelvus fidelis TaxID=2613842 RepID=UPI001780BC57|nr:Slp family lipoprotein [Marinihelvus fidelis]